MTEFFSFLPFAWILVCHTYIVVYLALLDCSLTCKCCIQRCIAYHILHHNKPVISVFIHRMRPRALPMYHRLRSDQKVKFHCAEVGVHLEQIPEIAAEAKRLVILSCSIDKNNNILMNPKTVSLDALQVDQEPSRSRQSGLLGCY